MQKQYMVLTIILSLLITISPLWSQDDQEFKNFNRAGKTIYNFLRVEQGARPAAMGGAFTAVSNDINAIFYNPAGLVNIQKMEYVFSYSNWLVGSRFFSGAVGYETSFGTFGLSFVHFGIDEFEETLPLQPEGTGRMVGAGNLAIGLAYARRITDKLSLGGHVRYIEENLDIDTRRTVAIDVATYYRTGFRDLTLGVALRNLGPDQAVSRVTRSESFPMPIDFNVTIASEILGSHEGPYSVLMSFENGFTVDWGDRYRLGTEIWLMNIVALRAGYHFNYSNQDFSLGVGLAPQIRGKKLNIDLAYTHFQEYFDAPLRISISGAF